MLVGRHAETGAVAAFLDAAAAGPAALVVEGEAGIGKTALWLAGLDEARRRGFAVLATRPDEAETPLAYVALADLLAGVGDDVLTTLPDPQRRAVDAALLCGPAGTSTGDRAVAAAFLGVLDRLAERAPVLVAVDDLQWVDTSTARVLAFATRRLAVPVGVLATLRGATGGDARWLRPPPPARTAHLTLPPLTLGALHQLVLDHTGRSFPRPEMTRIGEVSGGNPFYALELARTARRDGLPGTLAQVVDARLAELAPPVRTVLLAAAAAAEPTVDLLYQAVGSADVQAALDTAEREGIVSIDGARVRFTHPLLAAGVHEAAAAPDRRAVHQRLAALVEDPERRARHLALAAVRADHGTLAAIDTAAQLAHRRGAPAAAAQLLERAVQLGGDTPARRLRLAQHLFDSGEPDRARELLEAAVATRAPGPDRAASLRLLAIVRLQNDSYREAAEYLQKALDEAGDDHRVRAQVLVDLPFVLVNLGRIADALAMVGDSVDAATRLGDPTLTGSALASSVMVGFLAGNGLDREALEHALVLEDPQVTLPVMLRPSLIESLLLMWTGQLDAARERMLAVRQRCLDHGEESDLMFAAFHHVILECWRGDLTAARLIAEDAQVRAAQLGTDVPRAIGLATQANVAAYVGDVETAQRSAAEALEIFQRGSCLAVTVWPMVTLGFLHVSRGDHEAAAATLGPLAGAAAGMGYGEPTAAPFAPDAVEALVGSGRLDEARGLVTALEDSGRRLDRAWALAIGARCRALLLAAEGDLADAEAAAQAALVEHERLPMPFERARTLLVLGRIRRRQRRKQAAAQAIEAALGMFETLGTQLWAAQARADLDRVVVRRAAAGELTPSERRVAEFAARGLPNREVAAALFISPKTVEANLARVYHKLGIRSRAELGRWLGGAGIT